MPDGFRLTECPEGVSGIRVHGDRLVLVKNPDYWDAGGVAIERITLPIITDRAEIWDMYLNDELVVYQEGEE